MTFLGCVYSMSQTENTFSTLRITRSRTFLHLVPSIHLTPEVKHIVLNQPGSYCFQIALVVLPPDRGTLGE